MTSSRSSAFLRIGCLALAYALAMAVLAWAARDSLDGLREGSADLETLMAGAAAAGAWLCLVWLGLGFTAAMLAALPGTAGRYGAVVSRRITPQVVRRLAEVALGVTVAPGAALTGTTPALAHGGSPPPPGSVQGVVPEAALNVDVDGPVEAVPGQDMPRKPATSGSQFPSLDRPAGKPLPPPVEAPVAKRPTPEMTGYAPLAEPSAPVHLVTTVPPTKDVGDEPAEVVVRRGDSLWAITARHLGAGATDAAIAAEWPRWHAANRRVIGNDPDLLLPGQRLRAPAPDNTAQNKEGQ